MFIVALNVFEIKIKKIKEYRVQFDNFDRVHCKTFNIFIFDEHLNIFESIAKKLGITKFQLLREVLLTYLDMNKGK